MALNFVATPTAPRLAASPSTAPSAQFLAQAAVPADVRVATGSSGGVAFSVAFAAGVAMAASQRRTRGSRAARAAQTTTVLPTVDRNATKEFRRDLQRSENYHKFGKSQMDNARKELMSVSGSELVTKLRKNGFRLTVGDVTFVLADSYGFCWGVERAVAMAYEARNFFPDKNIWCTNEIIHNPSVNAKLQAMGMKFVPTVEGGGKDFSGVQNGDVVLLPAFGASIDEMALLKSRSVQIVDTTCPWVSKVWNSVEKTKEKGHTNIIHGKYSHEETIATKSFADKYLIVKDMTEAEYVSDYILKGGDKKQFLQKFAKAMSPDFDPDMDLLKVGVANQTTMLKGETELIGKLFERVMIKKFGPQEIDQHFVSFNTICDATQERQDAMYKMFGAEYEAPKSKLYADLEGEQVGVELRSGSRQQKLSSKAVEDATRGAAEAAQPAEHSKVDLCIVVGGFNSSNTTHLLEIAEEEGVPGYHIDTVARLGKGRTPNSIEHKPLSTTPADAMQERGFTMTEGFLPEGKITVGVTSGASTPDAQVGEVLERILQLKQGK
mmetsp:Transcript_93624/g.261943  ORF Transcript_93624/g.261943 Transcript_93624/m.261943 type:complete len:551 (+) Transcript_93624:80-1732(+)